MSQPYRSPRPLPDAAVDLPCEDIQGIVGGGACDVVLQAICRATNLGVSITIWDLPQVTDLALHDAFAAVRALEFGRMIRIGDNPSNPFGATLTLIPEGVEHLDRLRRA